MTVTACIHAIIDRSICETSPFETVPKNEHDKWLWNRNGQPLASQPASQPASHPASQPASQPVSQPASQPQSSSASPVASPSPVTDPVTRTSLPVQGISAQALLSSGSFGPGPRVALPACAFFLAQAGRSRSKRQNTEPSLPCARSRHTLQFSAAVQGYMARLWSKTVSKDNTMICVKAGLPMLKLQASAGSRHHRFQARKRRRLVEDAQMEDADVELIKKVQGTSLSGATRMPWYAKTKHQWDADLRITAADLVKSDRAQATASLQEAPRLPAPALYADSSSSSRSSNSDSSSTSMAPSPEEPRPPAPSPVPPGDKEFLWGIHAGQQKLYLGQGQLATNLSLYSWY